MTRAVDIDCPNRRGGCVARAGSYCNGGGADLCQERINAAARITRDANRARKKAATTKKEP